MVERTDLDFMGIALREAALAATENEVPVGAVLVSDGTILAQDHNRMVQQKNPLAHAEMLTLQKALKRHQERWLLNAVLYVTLEPCSMCAGASVLSRIHRLVYSTPDPKSGACGSVLNIANCEHLNHRVMIESGILQKESGALLSGFFQSLRKK